MERRRSPPSEVEEEDGDEYRSRLMYFSTWNSEEAPRQLSFGNRDLSLEAALSGMSLYNSFESAAPFRRGSFGLDAAAAPYACNGLARLGFSGRGGYLGAAAGFRHPSDELAALSESLRRQGLNSGGNGNHRFLRDTKPLSVTASEYFPGSSSVARSNGFHLPHRCDRYHRESLDFGALGGKIVRLAKGQPSSAALISKLDRGVVGAEIDVILPEILQSIDELFVDQFGNRFVQSLFTSCNEDQRTRILTALTELPNKFFTVCTDEYGSKAVNHLLGKLLTPVQMSLVVSALCPEAISFATHEYGHRVLQQCIRTFPPEYTTRVISLIASDCFRIAMDQSGCVVLQDCLDNSHGVTREFLIRQILSNILPLAEHRFGNYVVQRLLHLKIHNATGDAFRKLKGNFMYLSRNKFGSNVVEKFLKETTQTPLYAENVIRELVLAPDAPSLLVDPYGNYVVQTALSSTKGHVQKALIRFIESNSGSMQSSMYGKKVLVSLEKVKINQF